MTLPTFSAIVSLMALLLLAPAAGAQEQAEDGAKLFDRLECQDCHSIQARGIEKHEKKEEEKEGGLDFMFAEEEDDEEPPDLSGIAKKQDAEFFEKWLLKKIRNEDKKRHKHKFEGSDEELERIVQFLTTLDQEASSEGAP